MKFFTSIVAAGSLLATVLASPVIEIPASTHQLVKRTSNFNDLFAQVEAHTQAAINICIEADVDISAALEIREQIAAQIKADLDACAQLLLEAAAEIKASLKADVVAANDGCDDSCVEKVVVEKSEKFCEDQKVIVEKLGEDCVKDYIKPSMKAFGEFTECVDGLFVGVGVAVTGVVDAVLGATLSLVLGLDLDLGLGLGLDLGGLIGIGRS